MSLGTSSLNDHRLANCIVQPIRSEFFLFSCVNNESICSFVVMFFSSRSSYFVRPKNVITPLRFELLIKKTFNFRRKHFCIAFHKIQTILMYK